MSALVQLQQVDKSDQFIDFLRRLGCTVVESDGGVFDVSVTHPESVEDATDAITEWCTAWSNAHAPASAVVTASGNVEGISPGEKPAGAAPGSRTRRVALAGRSAAPESLGAAGPQAAGPGTNLLESVT